MAASRKRMTAANWRRKIARAEAKRERCVRLDELERCLRRLTQEDAGNLELAKAKAAAWASEMTEDELVFYVDAGMRAISPELRRKACTYFTAYFDQQVRA